MKVPTIIVLIAVAVALPAVAAAQTVRQAQPLKRSSAPVALRSTTMVTQKTYHPIKIGPHTFYGTIVGINGTSVAVRTRRQRLVTVDATNVLADGSYSAPLFVGKFVTVDGVQATNGIFMAAHIFRLTNLNALPDDR
jgi:hypothetical protein